MRELYEQLIALDERIGRADHLIRRVFPRSAACQKLAQVEGIGPVVATALVAAVGNAKEFANGRHLAAWLGLGICQLSRPIGFSLQDVVGP